MSKKELNDLLDYERELYDKGLTLIAGVDEVGRGPLYGPVVCAAVILPINYKLDGLTDSKKLTEKKREEFYEVVMKDAISVSVALRSPERIDDINIYAATKEAMIDAIYGLDKLPEHVLVDAMPLDIDIPTTSIIKGDAKSLSIAAASVIAKVTRDRMMYEIDVAHPEYGFKNHKGYPTKAHLDAIKEHGLIDGYRKSYGPVKEILESVK